jgi:hypothetical protein
MSHPHVADGSISVNGKNSSKKLTYLSLGDVSSYNAATNMVWRGAQMTSNPSPATGIQKLADPMKSSSNDTINRPQIPCGMRNCRAIRTGVGRGPVSYKNVARIELRGSAAVDDEDDNAVADGGKSACPMGVTNSWICFRPIRVDA